MTIEEALELFSKYGNISSNQEQLKKEKPSLSQLWTARAMCIQNVYTAHSVLLRHFELDSVQKAAEKGFNGGN